MKGREGSGGGGGGGDRRRWNGEGEVVGSKAFTKLSTICFSPKPQKVVSYF